MFLFYNTWQYKHTTMFKFLLLIRTLKIKQNRHQIFKHWINVQQLFADVHKWLQIFRNLRAGIDKGSLGMKTNY